MITTRHCKEADGEHKNSLRQYAHTFHHSDNVICVAAAWQILPLEFQMGLVAHEIGHLLHGYTNHSETDADKAANKFLKITIRYKDSLYGDRLQYLSYRDTLATYKWVTSNIKFDSNLFM